jgi:hypothetical protein
LEVANDMLSDPNDRGEVANHLAVEPHGPGALAVRVHHHWLEDLELALRHILSICSRLKGTTGGSARRAVLRICYIATAFTL